MLGILPRTKNPSRRFLTEQQLNLMAKKFKDYYDDQFIDLIIEKLNATSIQWDEPGFKRYLEDRLFDLEFLDRQDTIAQAFEIYLGDDYVRNLETFGQILGPKLTKSEGMFTEGWWLWPVGRYVERHATEAPSKSLKFIHALTQRFTGEFAVRPLLQQKPGPTLKTMSKWSRDRSVHVRRLASEGLRVRLPWAKKLNVALEHFEEFRSVLNQLKSDPEKFVQKSVGNNLNDLMKEDADKAWAIIHDWESDNPSPETQWIIKHGTRSLRKKKR